jgi:(E)-4-hydroxy-3-methylbut-2-enyl-diphosphate synthase
MAEEIQGYLGARRAAWQARYPGSEELRVAVMGCVVNGPGEQHADIGSPPGAEEPRAPVYVDGALKTTLKGESIVADFLHILDDYVERRFGSADRAPERHVAVGMHEADISLPKNHS